MLEVTQSALANVKNYLDQQKIDSAVRVNLMSGSCAGPRLGLAIDDANAKDNDHIFDHGGVIFLVDKGVAETCGAIKVDFIEEKDAGCGCGGGGFVITNEKPLSGSSCGCSCSSGSCG
jgi:iron-sulfur cluster assembly accessory protein